jgi:hypothetical protein
VLLGALSSVACSKASPAPPTSGATGKLVGRYKITSGSRPGGPRGAYAGNVEITTSGAHYVLRWEIPDTPASHGVGIEIDDLLAAGSSPDGDYELIVYEISGGRLSGRVAAGGGSGKLGTEELSGPTGLNGTFKVVSASSASGRSYDGTVSIAPHGSAYRMIWTLGRGSESGVGLKKGSRLLAARGKTGAAVLVYSVVGTKLHGQWAQPSRGELGTEYLSRL